MMNVYQKVDSHTKYCTHIRYLPSALSITIFPIRSYHIKITTPTLKLCQISLFYYLLLLIYNNIRGYYMFLLHENGFLTIIVHPVETYEAKIQIVIWILFLHTHILLTSVKSSALLISSDFMSPTKFKNSIYQ